MPCSTKQISYITSLVTDRYSSDDAAVILAGMPFDDMTGGRDGEASGLINKLKLMPLLVAAAGLPAPVGAADRHGANSSPGRCYTCGHTVDARQGFYYGPFTGGTSKWRTHHADNACDTTPAPEPVEVEEGYWHVGTDVFQIYKTRNQRLAGKQLAPVTNAWNYTAGAVTIVAAGGEKLTAEQLSGIAKRFGVAHDKCMFCSLPLSDPRSNPALGGAGYGPVCASKHGLAWG